MNDSQDKENYGRDDENGRNEPGRFFYDKTEGMNDSSPFTFNTFLLGFIQLYILLVSVDGE